MEFIINEHIGVHPMALVHPDKIASRRVRAAVAQLVKNYSQPTDFFIQKLAEGVGTIAAAFYPRPVIVRLSDFKTNGLCEPARRRRFRAQRRKSDARLPRRGALFAPGLFRRLCIGMPGIGAGSERDGTDQPQSYGAPFCRRATEARQVIETMAQHGLKRGDNGLEIYVMCEVPNNVIQIDAFAQLFDGFSIGSNDLTQLTLGVDRDSEIVAFDFDERDLGMLEMLRLAVTGAKRNRRHVGICGEAPANYPQIARFLTELGIDSISVTAASLLRTFTVVHEAEQQMAAASPLAAAE
jgi:pyruvate, water dikinase